MDKLTNDEFIQFMDSFKDKYFLPVSEISKSKDEKEISLVDNSFKMFSLDDMCKKYKSIRDNLPKTMDAIHYEIDETGKLTLFLIEFKNFSIEGNHSIYSELEALYLNLKKKNKKTIDEYSSEKIISNNFLKKFKNIKNHFIDSIEFDLKMKPLETIFVALPWLYEEYCTHEKIPKKDFRKFLEKNNIRLIIFVNRYSPKHNISSVRMSAHAIDNALKEQFKRLELSHIIQKDNQRIKAEFQFSNFLKKEHLTEK